MAKKPGSDAAKVPEKQAAATQAKGDVRSTLREYLEAFGMAILLALFIRTFLIQAFKIPSESMKPTLLVGDHLLVNKFLYGIRIPFIEKRVFEVFKPQKDDVIVFVYPEDRTKDFIKRVKAIAGDTIEVKDKVVYINGQKVDDPHAWYEPGARLVPARDNFGPFTVPDGQVFVMGDNRDHSHDSRFWGTVPIDDILGKAFILYWSWDSDTFRPRLSRMGSLIQ
ncbi:MAG TPA: signal peptidase I [Candidatus Binatia bacterium]|jgi:signal peptidase I